MSKNVSGPFAARNLGNGAWQLTTDDAGGPEVLLKGAGPEAEFLVSTPIERLTVSWRREDVELTLISPHGVRVLTAASAIVHEPDGRLYQSLPLAGFDADARRFWRRVFALLRIPGGRLLLGIVSRRRRDSSRR